MGRHVYSRTAYQGRAQSQLGSSKFGNGLAGVDQAVLGEVLALVLQNGGSQLRPIFRTSRSSPEPKS